MMMIKLFFVEIIILLLIKFFSPKRQFFVNFTIYHFVSLIFFYILDLLGKMPTKVWFIRQVHNNIQIDENIEKRQITRYKQTKEKNYFKMKFDLWQIIF
jgi:hypothetical protein